MLGWDHCQVHDAFYESPAEVVIYEQAQLGEWHRITRKGQYDREAQTTLKLSTGGRSEVRRNNLFVLAGGADLILDKKALPPYEGNTPKRPIPNEQVTIGALGTLGADGRLYKALPDNATYDVTPKVSSDFYAFRLTQQKHEVQMNANDHPLGHKSLTENAGFCVGQKVIYSIQLIPPLDPGLITAQNHQWLIPETMVNASEEFCPAIGDPLQGSYFKTTCHPVRRYLTRGMGSEGPPDLPYCQMYSREQWPLTQAETGVWWVSGGKKLSACFWELEFSNGQRCSLVSHGLVDVFKPWFSDFTDVNPIFPSSPRTFMWDYSILSYGDSSGESGLYWEAKVTSIFPGTLGICQLVNAKYTQNDGYPYPMGRDTLDTHGQIWLDGNSVNYEEQPYVVDNVASHTIGISDHPAETLYPIYPINVRMWGAFKDYLRFKPSGEDSIYVTLGVNSWTMEGKATVQIDVNSTPAPTPLSASEEFPIWHRVKPEEPED
jgi:hypothetical protein